MIIPACMGYNYNFKIYTPLNMACRAEPNMLKILPIIIPSRTSQIFDPLFLSSPIIPTYSCNFYCIGDNNVHNPTCITVYIENTRYSSYVLFCNTTVNSQ